MRLDKQYSYITKQDLKRTFLHDDKEYYIFKDLTKPLQVGTRVVIAYRTYYVHRSERLAQGEGVGAWLVEAHYKYHN